jgi:hypothetical protein
VIGVQKHNLIIVCYISLLPLLAGADWGEEGYIRVERGKSALSVSAGRPSLFSLEKFHAPSCFANSSPPPTQDLCGVAEEAASVYIHAG